MAGELQQANEELKLSSDAIAPQLRASVDTLSAQLASRVLGVDVPSTTVSGTTVSGR